jgi:hypothetical protein
MCFCWADNKDLVIRGEVSVVARQQGTETPNKQDLISFDRREAQTEVACSAAPACEPDNRHV